MKIHFDCDLNRDRFGVFHARLEVPFLNRVSKNVYSGHPEMVPATKTLRESLS
jgi:hypothetical protein